MSGRRSSRSLVAPILSVLVAGLLTAVPVAASAAEEGDEYVEARSKANVNTSTGSSSEFGEAFAEAGRRDKPVEVVSERRASTQVFANPDGTITQEVSQTPMFAKDGDGDYRKLDPSLVRDGSRLSAKVGDDDVSFSADGEGATTQLETRSGDPVKLTFVGDLGAPDVDGGVATYAVTGNDNESLHVSTTASGFATRVHLEEAPAEAPVYRFKVTAPGLDVSIDDQMLTIRDGGKVVAQSRPLQMWDADVDDAGAPENPVAVAAKVVTSDGESVLELRPSMDYLSSPEREYPVVVDPDLQQDPVEMDPQGDTYIFRTQEQSNQKGSDVNLRVGSNDGSRQFRSILWFRYKRFAGLDVSKAELKLRQYHNGASNCTTAKSTIAFPMVAGDKTQVWWGNQPTYTTDQRFRKTYSGPNFGNNCNAGNPIYDVTPMMNGWAGGHTTGDTGGQNRQGIFLVAGDETDTSFEKRFCSKDWDSSSPSCGNSNVIPTLSVTYQPELGTQSWYSTTDHTLDERSSLSVNNRNGNAVISSQDATIKGVGQDLAISRTYNSQATEEATSLGKGWNLGFGPDVRIEKKSDWRFDYIGPTGTVLGSFVRESTDSTKDAYREFNAPIGGIGADLSERAAADGGGFTLKFRKSPLRYDFHKVVGGDSYLTKIRDRSGNRIDFDYAAGGTGRPKLTQITDTQDRHFSVTYTGDRITKITQDDGLADVGTREWNYEYNANGQLTKFTDALGNSTAYGYTGGRVTLIVGPGTAAKRSETTLVYDGAGQTTKVYYRKGEETGEARYTYTWNYRTTAPSPCPSAAGFSTGVTDPNGKTTNYCFADRGDSGSLKKAWVYDGAGNSRSLDYTADNGPQASTDGRGGSTVNKYSSGLTDRLQSSTQPTNTGSSNSLSSGMEYGSNTGEDAYLPSAVRRDTDDCNRYGYDAKGRTTVSYSGITANSSGECGQPDANTDSFHRRYDDATGNVTSSWDANAPSSPTDDDKTKYDYWKAGQSGFVPKTQDLLKSVKKPGGDCSTGSARKLCTSYTYDGSGRVATMTDGRGKVTAYTYDKNDRVTGVYYDGSNPSNCNASVGNACLQYGYDAAGNMLTRSSALEQTTYVYDRMNRLIEQQIPTGALLAFDQVTMGYDGVGNLTSYNQSVAGGGAQNVAYGYDDANRLTTITEGGETINVKTDEDGRTQEITFPAPSGAPGAKVQYDYLKNGRPQELRLKTHAGTEYGKVTYSYRIDDTTKDSARLQKWAVPTSTEPKHQGTVSYTYSKERLTAATESNVSGRAAKNYSYEYDKIGNLTKETAEGTTTHFGYDAAGQLCWKGPNTGTKLAQSCPSTPSGDTTVNRDAAGNSLGTTADPYTVNDRSQVATIDGFTQKYLDQGNDLRRDNGNTRNVESTLGVTAQKQGAVTIFYLRDPNGTIMSSRLGNDRVNYVSETSGNVVWLVNPNGTQIGAYRYSPYGKTTTYGETVANNNRFRWLGAQQNVKGTTPDDTGHYKLGARYNDTQGHFTQPDPLSGGMNDPRTLTGYNYAAGDPINLSDPSGRCWGPDIGCDFAKASISLGAAFIQTDLQSIQTCFLPALGSGVSDGVKTAGANLLFPPAAPFAPVTGGATALSSYAYAGASCKFPIAFNQGQRAAGADG